MDFTPYHITVLFLFIIVSGDFILAAQMVFVFIEELIDFRFDLGWNLIAKKFQCLFTCLINRIVGVVVNMFCTDQLRSASTTLKRSWRLK